MAQITYQNKVALNENPDILDINKVTDDDMNEIKSAHNDTDNKTSAILNTFGITTNTWVSGTSYTVGTMVVYEYKIYKCISATSGTTAPSSDTTHWEEISMVVEDVYSTSEVKTNKVWIDGKPIYRKVVETSFTGTQVSKSYTLSDLGLSSVSTFTKLKSMSNHDPIEEDYYAGTNDYVRTFINNTGLNIMIGSSYPTKPVTIYTIVEYTKTTD